MFESVVEVPMIQDIDPGCDRMLIQAITLSGLIPVGVGGNVAMRVYRRLACCTMDPNLGFLCR